MPTRRLLGFSLLLEVLLSSATTNRRPQHRKAARSHRSQVYSLRLRRLLSPIGSYRAISHPNRQCRHSIRINAKPLDARQQDPLSSPLLPTISSSPIRTLPLQQMVPTSSLAFAPTSSFRPISLPLFDLRLGKQSYRICSDMSSFAFPLWPLSPCAPTNDQNPQAMSRTSTVSKRSSICSNRDSPRKGHESWRSSGKASNSLAPRCPRMTAAKKQIKTSQTVYSESVSSPRLSQICSVRTNTLPTITQLQFLVDRFGKTDTRETGRGRLGISSINLLLVQVRLFFYDTIFAKANFWSLTGCVLVGTPSIETWTRNRRLAALGHYPAWMSPSEALSGTADKIFRLSGILFCSSNSSQSGQKVKRVESKEKAPKGRGSKGKKVVFVESWERPWLYVKLVSSPSSLEEQSCVLTIRSLDSPSTTLDQSSSSTLWLLSHRDSLFSLARLKRRRSSLTLRTNLEIAARVVDHAAVAVRPISGSIKYEADFRPSKGRLRDGRRLPVRSH